MVSKKDQEVYESVLDRDLWMFWKSRMGAIGLAEWLASSPWVCVATVIDPSLWGTCSGEMERDHVHSHTGGTKGKRAPTEMENLVILCHHHHQDGWATSHRPEIRTYIKEANERYRRFADRR
jgi:hypothetical protein